MVVIEVVPYLTSEERRLLTKGLKDCRVFIYPAYIYIEKAVAMQ